MKSLQTVCVCGADECQCAKNGIKRKARKMCLFYFHFYIAHGKNENNDNNERKAHWQQSSGE